MASRISSAEIGARPEGVVVAISAAGREPVGEPAGPSTLIIRRLGRDESSGRKGSSTGGGPGSSRLRRGSRCTRKDSIRRNRAQSHILQTPVREIHLRGAHRHRSLHENHHRGSRLRRNRLYARHRRRERTPQAAESSRQPPVRTSYKHFPHHASSFGTISFPKIRPLAQRDYSAIEGRSRSTDRERGRSIIDRIKIQLDHNRRRNAPGHPPQAHWRRVSGNGMNP
jgi:hypothetical protein